MQFASHLTALEQFNQAEREKEILHHISSLKYEVGQIVNAMCIVVEEVDRFEKTLKELNRLQAI